MDTAPPVVMRRREGLVSLTGYVLPWKNGPIVAAVPGSPYTYVVCFSTAEKLRSAMAVFGWMYDSIKQVDDGKEFFLSCIKASPDMKVMADPYLQEDGRTRFVHLEWLPN